MSTAGCTTRHKRLLDHTRQNPTQVTREVSSHKTFNSGTSINGSAVTT